MRSIRTHLVLSLTFGLLILFSAAGLGLYEYMEEVLERSLDAELAAKAQQIAAAVHLEEDGEPHLRLSDSIASAGVHDERPYYFQIWRVDRRTLARFAPRQSENASLPFETRHHRPFGDARLADGTEARIARLTFTAQPDEDESDNGHTQPVRPAEPLTIVVAHSRLSVDLVLAVLFTGLIFAAVILVGGVLMIVTWGVRRSLQPLDEVGRLADRINGDSLNLRFPAGEFMPGELRPISIKLNELLDRVSEAFAHERRFSAAVAHELRTPVAELRTLCEVCLRWPDDKDAAIAAVNEAMAIATEMGTVVENLMSLARCQAGVEKPHFESVRLLDSVNEVLLQYAAQSDSRQLTILVEIDPALMVVTDRQMLSVILRNLLTNAVTYTDSAGEIRIAAEATKLLIGNSAGSLAYEDIPHLAEAFWRKDAARTGGTHAGLGLAIVNAHCQIADIVFSCQLVQAGWFQVILEFPNASIGTGITPGQSGPDS
jgi:signal transduction histidine kinase